VGLAKSGAPKERAEGAHVAAKLAEMQAAARTVGAVSGRTRDRYRSMRAAQGTSSLPPQGRIFYSGMFRAVKFLCAAAFSECFAVLCYCRNPETTKMQPEDR
jgi:hypothetical protein